MNLHICRVKYVVYTESVGVLCIQVKGLKFWLGSVECVKSATVTLKER